MVKFPIGIMGAEIEAAGNEITFDFAIFSIEEYSSTHAVKNLILYFGHR